MRVREVIFDEGFCVSGMREDYGDSNPGTNPGDLDGDGYWAW